MNKRIFSLLLALCLLISFPACAEKEPEKDWYTDTANKLVSDLHALISMEQFDEYFTTNEEIHEQIGAWSAAMEQGEISVHGFDMPGAALLMAMAEITAGSIPDILAEYIERRMGSTLVSMINGMMGVNFLAASSIAIVSEGYLMPEGFTPCMIVYEYEGICVSVSFAQIGEGVVMGTAQFTAPEIVGLLNGTYEE